MIIGQKPARLEFEGVRLLSSFADVKALAAERRWPYQIPDPPGEQYQQAELQPGGTAVERIALVFEGGIVTNIKVHYRSPDPTRTAIKSEYVDVVHVDGGWALSDGDRDTIVLIPDDGLTLDVLHAKRTANQSEAQRMFAFYFPPIPTHN